MSSHNVIVIGSGPAGLTAALYSARANMKPFVIEGLEAGGQLMLTTLVENWPGFRDGIMGPELMAEMRAQAERFGAEVVRGQVSSVDLRTHPFKVTMSGVEHTARALIIATGASARLLGLPSERALLGHGVSTCATCDGYFFRGKPIAVVGGGDSALEEAIFLTRFASQRDRRPPARLAARVEDHAGQGVRESEDHVRVELATSSTSRTMERARSPECPSSTTRPANGRTSRSTACSWPSATPRTPVLFQGQLELDANGYIVTHMGSRTSVPGVFACGDVQDHIYRQAITAAGSGCMAAIDAEHFVDGLPQHIGEPERATEIAESVAAGRTRKTFHVQRATLRRADVHIELRRTSVARST